MSAANGSQPFRLMQINATVPVANTVVIGRKAMQYPYRVTFFKTLVDSTGHPVNAVQGAIELKASDTQSAMERARLAFAERKQVGDWSLRADSMNVEALVAADQVQASRRQKRGRSARR
jgi:hypothetical protein